jgi:hypothetical protein
LGYRSKAGFTRDYTKWGIDGHGTTSTQVGRKPLLQPYYYAKAKADAKHITKDVGGMPFMKFMEFISPYVQDSKKSDGSAAHFPDQYPVNSLATKATFEAYYREILPCKVRNGDRALQQRLNVRNDMLAWISQHVMSIVALQGHDGELYPFSIDKQVPQSFSTLNIDAFAVKAEGGSFDKCQGRTTQEAVASSEETFYGPKFRLRTALLL